MRSWLVAVGLSLACFGCKPPGWSNLEATRPMVLRTYDAPPGQAARIRESLKAVLWLSTGEHDGHWVGRVDNLPNNQLVVLAAPEVQTGVRELIDEASQHPYPEEKTIELRYWLVVGKPNPKA